MGEIGFLTLAAAAATNMLAPLTPAMRDSDSNRYGAVVRMRE